MVGGGERSYLAGHEDVGCEERAERVGRHLVALLLLHQVEQSEQTLEHGEVLARQQLQQQLYRLQLLVLLHHVCGQRHAPSHTF